MLSPQRFRDARHTKYDFLDHVLVRCPKCAGTAHVAPMAPVAGGGALSVFTRRRLVCRACGLSRDAVGGRLCLYRGRGEAKDPYFGLPLWLQTEMRHGWLWAYNPEHLELIRQFVQAPLRERAPFDGQVRMTLVARLPTWIKSAKNREEVLRAIDRIRSSLVA
ncbi:hypothetical protein C1J00_04140 [Streptomyces cahuitamycinicus]|uniref:Uncharacterized protein n=1 Tax=Streptomyces cahuitamycinicus TaxID=2070367 RepID=A0A2N8TWL9_9ACTN|nr:hypothetical protein [Streptomyces cahuitamycinicus]PNG23401.1 hypothetical protein C1J00_04140 [Streptomyces cahuitamycinicus]